MAHPLITIESRGSNKRDFGDINLSSLIANAPISDARTSAIKPNYYHPPVAAESIYHNDRDNNSLAASSQVRSSSSTAEGTAEAEAADAADIPVWRLVNIVLAVAGISFLSSFSTGVLTIGLPRTAADVGLPEDLTLWLVF